MGHPQLAKYAPGLLLRRLLSSFSLDWVALFLDLLHSLRHVWSAGLYEFLLYDATLELRDDQGCTAVFRKHQRVKFLQDNIIAFEDYAWGAPRGAV